MGLFALRCNKQCVSEGTGKPEVRGTGEGVARGRRGWRWRPWSGVSLCICAGRVWLCVHLYARKTESFIGLSKKNQNKICGELQMFNHFDLLHLNGRIMNLQEMPINLQSGAHEDIENFFTGLWKKNTPLLKLIVSFSINQKFGNHDAGVWKKTKKKQASLKPLCKHLQVVCLQQW